jgi:hypothetical protein
MNWMLVAAAFGAGTVAMLTDWLFMGVMFHDAYRRYPEIWRPGIAEGKERGAIIASCLIGYVMSGGVAALCLMADAQDIVDGVEIAIFAWLAGPFPVLAINHFFFKLDPKVTFTQCAGYLARMALAGGAAGYVLT